MARLMVYDPELETSKEITAAKLSMVAWAGKDSIIGRLGNAQIVIIDKKTGDQRIVFDAEK